MPGGCTKLTYIQVPNVCWKKAFKAACTEYDGWMGTLVIHEETSAGNLKAHPKRTIFQWILDSWAELHCTIEVIKKSFLRCALNVLWTDQKMNHCLEERQPCSNGWSMLWLLLKILNELGTNTFECSSSDILRKHIPHYSFWTRILPLNKYHTQIKKNLIKAVAFNCINTVNYYIY